MGKFDTVHYYDDLPRKLPRALSSYVKPGAPRTERSASLSELAIERVVSAIHAREMQNDLLPGNKQDLEEAVEPMPLDVSTIPGCLAAQAFKVIYDNNSYDTLPPYSKSTLIEEIAARAVERANTSPNTSLARHIPDGS